MNEGKENADEKEENEVTDVLSRMTKINQRFMALRTRTASVGLYSSPPAARF